jgi:hypothetical protein
MGWDKPQNHTQAPIRSLKERRDERVARRKARAKSRLFIEDPLTAYQYFPDYAQRLHKEDLRDPEREVLMYLGPINVVEDIQDEKLKSKLDTLTLKKNAELQHKVEELEAKLVEIEKPSWGSLIKEWFMYKVLRRPKQQPLQLGPYR